MIQRAVEISGHGRHLRKERGFLVVSEDKEELARLPLDDLEVVLLAGHALSCTGELLNTLADRCIPLIVCDHRFMPASMLWPIESHRLQSGRIRKQSALSVPRQKQLWKQLVRAKIRAQAQTLELCTGRESARLQRLATEVRSGDTGNAEGQAARAYWQLLFGPQFRRDPDLEGLNALLNYGYAVLRAAVARAVMLAGLHPAFGLHHHNLNDTMPLVDDLIEPFRPVVDLLVFDLDRQGKGKSSLDAAAKERLVAVTAVDMIFDGVSSPVSECLLRMTRSLADVAEGTRKDLLLPEGLRIQSHHGEET